jgi:hypothetical protein
MCGEWDIDRLEDEMPMSLLYEWIAFANLEPLLFSARYRQNRADWNAAMVATTIGNTMLATHVRHPRWLKMEKLMYPDSTPGRQKTPSELYKMLKAAVIGHAIVGN